MAWVEANLGILAAVAVYFVTFVLISELLNRWSKANGGKALILSWLVGLLIFELLAIWGLLSFSLACFLLFVVITGLTNTAYKFTSFKKWVRWLAGLLVGSGGAE